MKVKKILIAINVLLISALFNSAFGQESIKAGILYNIDLDGYPFTNRINFVSYEFGYETFISKHSSFDFAINYGVRKETVNELLAFKEIELNQKIAYRYTKPFRNFNLYFKGGITIGYVTEVDYRRNDKYSPFNVTKLNPELTLTTFFGPGITLDLNKHFGVDFGLMYSPTYNAMDVDYGTSGYLRESISLNYQFGKKK